MQVDERDCNGHVLALDRQLLEVQPESRLVAHECVRVDPHGRRRIRCRADRKRPLDAHMVEGLLNHLKAWKQLRRRAQVELDSPLAHRVPPRVAQPLELLHLARKRDVRGDEGLRIGELRDGRVV